MRKEKEKLNILTYILMILFISILLGVLGIIGLLVALKMVLKHKGKIDLKLNLRKMEMDLRKDE